MFFSDLSGKFSSFDENNSLFDYYSSHESYRPYLRKSLYYSVTTSDLIDVRILADDNVFFFETFALYFVAMETQFC